MAVNETGRDHAGHDELLVVAYASDDLSGREGERAAALAADCAECARLVADVRELRTNVAALPVPRRTRDFRLTDADAERLRPRGWHGLVALLAGPRLSFAAPIGTALATIGIAGLLVATAPSLFLAGTASAPALTASGGANEQSAESAAAGVGNGASDTGAAAVPAPAAHASAAASAAPSAGAVEPYAAASAAPDQAVTSPPLAAAPNPVSATEPAATLPAQAKSAAEPAPTAEARVSTERSSPGATAESPPWLAIASSVLVLVGLVLLLGRLAVRRISA